MSTLEKTIDLLYALPENQVEVIYSFVQFLSSQQKAEKPVINESLDDILSNIVGVLPDTGKTLEEYRAKGYRNGMKLLIDTNVILDMVFQRKGCDDSTKLFRKIRESGDSAYITASSVTDLFYIIRKEMHDTERTYAIMDNIFKLVANLSVTEKDIRDAFGQKWKDYADVSLSIRTPAAWLDESGRL